MPTEIERKSFHNLIVFDIKDIRYRNRKIHEGGLYNALIKMRFQPKLSSLGIMILIKCFSKNVSKQICTGRAARGPPVRGPSRAEKKEVGHGPGRA